MKTNIKRLSLAAAVLGLVMGGTSLTLINQVHASTGAQTTQQTKNATINISQSDAINKVNEKFGSKSIKEIEVKNKKDKYIYEVEGFDSEKEYKVKIDANTGKILKAKSEKLDDDEKKQEALDLSNLMSRGEATKLAQTKASGQAVKWSLEMDNNKPVWKVEFKDGNKEIEVKIDAKDQKILKVKTDDKKDSKDKHAKDHSESKNKDRDHDKNKKSESNDTNDQDDSKSDDN